MKPNTLKVVHLGKNDKEIIRMNPKIHTGPEGSKATALTKFQDMLDQESTYNKLEKIYPTRAQGRKMAERMVKIVLSQVSKNYQLAKCTPKSLYLAIFEAAQLGLDFGVANEAYIVPYKDKAQFQIGYRGLIKLARQSGEIKKIEARVVYEDDYFEVEYGLTNTIIHKADYKKIERGEAIAFYAVATLKDGETQFEVMNRAEVDKIKATSQAAGSSYSPWNTFYEEMAKKTVIKRLMKLLPYSMEVASAIDYDNQEYKEVIDVTPMEPKKDYRKPLPPEEREINIEPEPPEEDIPLYQDEDPGPIPPEETEGKKKGGKKSGKSEQELRDEVAELAEKVGAPRMAALLSQFGIDSYFDIPPDSLEDFIKAQKLSLEE